MRLLVEYDVARRNPRTHRTRFVNPFLENLALLVFAVVHHLVFVDRLVQLPLRRVDAELAKHAFHAEGARFVGNDRHDARSDVLVAHQLRQRAHERLRRRNLTTFGSRLEHRLKRVEPGRGDLFVGVAAALRHESAEGTPALQQVLHLC